MHLCLVRYTPIFCRPYTRGAIGSLVPKTGLSLSSEDEKSVSYAE